VLVSSRVVGVVLATTGVLVSIVVATGVNVVGVDRLTEVLTCGDPVVHADIITTRMIRDSNDLDFITFPICKTS